jgi:uncharacterized protein (TIGR04255 family)
MKLPKKLGKEPLIEAVFEMRFTAKAPVSSILPGLVFTKFAGEKTIEKLPMAELPEPLLTSLDPNFRYAPSVRIHWDNFMILCSNRSVGLACKSPYPGWTKGFKPAILKLAGLIGEAALVDAVERFSLKYTNILSSELGGVPSVVEFVLKIGSHNAAGSLFQIRTEIRKNSNVVSVVQIAAHGSATSAEGITRQGVPFDIDTIAIVSNLAFPAFLSALDGGLEVIHSEAKTIFFDCLKPDALAKLEPVYD